MRIILQYYHDFLQKRTQKIEIDPEETTTQLLEKISQKVGRPMKNLIVKFKRDGYTLRVLPGWPLIHYDIYDGLHIQVDIMATEQEQKIKENKRLQHRYLYRLGLDNQKKLESVDEDSEGEDDKIDELNPKISNDSTNQTFDRSKSVSSNEDNESKQTDRIAFAKKGYLDRFQKDLFRITKTGQLEEIEKLINNLDDVPEDYRSKMKSQKLELINTATFSGWNTLHFAVFQSYPQLVEYFIEKGADINKPTEDGRSPLQISIHKNNMEIFKILMNQSKIKVNLLTEKGLALNIACRTGNLNMIQMLMLAHANPNLKDKEGFSAAHYSNSQEASQIIQQQIKSPEKIEDQSMRIQPNFHVFQPPKPPSVKGFIDKTSGLFFRMNKRFFVLNPDDGTFIRYSTFQDYPMKPLEIIPLRNIKHVQICSKQWYMKDSLSYFEVFYTSRLILACKNENAAKAWVVFLFQAAVYSIYQEDRMKNGDSEAEEQLPEKTIEIVISDDDDNIAPEVQNLLNKYQPLDLPNSPSQLDGNEKSQQEQRNRIHSVSPQRDRDDKDPLVKSASPSRRNTGISDSEVKEEIKDLIQDSRVNFESFEVLKILGSGAFGKVFLVRKKDDDIVFAMKALKKRNLIIKKQLKYAVTEANILKQCQHPFILSLHYAFQTPNQLYLVLDYCPGGDLSYHLTQNTKFSEKDTRFYIAELVLAIEYLHLQNVVYRDLKPENILLDKDGHIKLADFGLSKEGVGDTDKTKSFCGSPAYLSPEMLSQKGSGKSSDIYGVGAVMFEMLTGEPPFYSDDIPTMYKNIKEGVLKFPQKLSEEAKNCVKRLLERDPVKRLGTKNKQEIKDDPFFYGIDWNKVVKREYRAPITDFSDLQDDEIEDDGIGYNGKPVLNDYDYDKENFKVNRVIKFSFSKGQT